MTTVTKEIERKWLVDDTSYIGFVESLGHGLIKIEQSYKGNARYRKSVHFRMSDSTSHKIEFEETRKVGDGLVRTEITERLTEAEYMEKTQHLAIMYKTRIELKRDEHVLQIDLYEDPTSDLEVLYRTVEIEFESEEAALEFNDIPYWFGDEVTGIKEFSAKGIYEQHFNDATNHQRGV